MCPRYCPHTSWPGSVLGPNSTPALKHLSLWLMCVPRMRDRFWNWGLKTDSFTSTSQLFNNVHNISSSTWYFGNYALLIPRPARPASYCFWLAVCNNATLWSTAITMVAFRIDSGFGIAIKFARWQHPALQCGIFMSLVVWCGRSCSIQFLFCSQMSLPMLFHFWPVTAVV